MSSVHCKLWSVKCEVWSVECGVECEMVSVIVESVEGRVGRVQSRVASFNITPAKPKWHERRQHRASRSCANAESRNHETKLSYKYCACHAK